MTRKARAAENSGGSAAGAPKRVRGRPFKKGQSGNPGGRPKTVKEVQELAATYTEEAVLALVTTMRRCQGGRQADGTMSFADWKEVRQAAVAILNRACGMPSQPIEGVPGRPLDLGIDALIDELSKIAGERQG